jgi:hypothetical protein
VQGQGRLADAGPTRDHRDRRRRLAGPVGQQLGQHVERRAATGEVGHIGRQLTDRRLHDWLHDTGRPGLPRPGLDLTGQHLLMQLTQRRARLDTELVDQNRAHPLKRPQRLRLPTTARQREHQPVPGLLAQRVLLDKVLQLADQHAVPATLQVRVDASIQRGQPRLGEPGRLRRDRR